MLPQKQREDLGGSQRSDQLVSVQDALGFALPGIAPPMGCKDNLTFGMEHNLESIYYSIMTKAFNSSNWAFCFYINTFREADF